MNCDRGVRMEDDRDRAFCLSPSLVSSVFWCVASMLKANGATQPDLVEAAVSLVRRSKQREDI